MAIQLIDQETGNIDWLLVAQSAFNRASREYGGDNFPPVYLRRAQAWCEERATAERLQWRQHRGLPDESPCSMVSVPSWGASGDSFGRR